MPNLRWLELRQKAQSLGRPLKCPLCSFCFSFRHLRRAGRSCPRCKVPLGYPHWYRVLLVAVGECAGVLVIYSQCKGKGADWFGYFITALPFAFVAGLAAQVFMQNAFPPKLAPHAEGSTWLKPS
jgi:hypothetical protein